MHEALERTSRTWWWSKYPIVPYMGLIAIRVRFLLRGARLGETPTTARARCGEQDAEQKSARPCSGCVFTLADIKSKTRSHTSSNTWLDARDTPAPLAQQRAAELYYFHTAFCARK